MARTPQNPICTAMEATFKKWHETTYQLPWITRSIGADRKNLNEIYFKLKQLCVAKGTSTDNATMLALFKHYLEAGEQAGIWFMKRPGDKFSLNNLNQKFNQVIAGITGRTIKSTEYKQADLPFDE